MADDIVLSFGDGEQALPGDHAAVCVDLQDLGVEYQRDGRPRHSLALWFELAGLRQRDGRPFFIRRKFGATLSNHPNAKLLPFLTAWRGRSFTPEELASFRIVNVVGQSCVLRLVKSQPDATGMSWTNIESIMPAREQVRPSGLYVRRQPQTRQPVYQQPSPQQAYQQPMQLYPSPACHPSTGYSVPPPNPQPAPTPPPATPLPPPSSGTPAKPMKDAQLPF
jgi:hypothetical protein